MPNYWDATADPNVGISPYSGQLHYGQHDVSSDPFTSQPSSDGSGKPIEAIEAEIHNMHPEHIAALADQWDNAHTLMQHMHDFLFKQSTELEQKHWKSPKAQHAFLQKGPGEALVYLDLWMEAAQTNATALRHLVLVAQDARRDIDEVMRKYREELANAKNNVDFGDQLGEWVQGLTVTWSEAQDREIHENVQTATKKWTIEAQKVAYRVGQQFYPYISKVAASGVGPPVQPLNTVLNAPGHPTVNFPAGIPGGPSAKPPPKVAVNQPKNPPGTLPTDPHQLIQNQLPPPPPVTPPAPVPPPAPAPVPAATGTSPVPQAAVPPPMPLPAPPPGFAKSTDGLSGGVPGPGTLPAGAPKPGLAPSLPPGGAGTTNPGQLTKNAFQRPGTPGTSPPGKTLRRPSGEGGAPSRPGARDLQRKGNAPGRPGAGEPHQPGRPGDRRKGDRSENTERTPGTPIDGEEAFGRPTGNATAPVLKNPTGDRNRRRPGSADELRPAAPGSGEEPRREGAAPPVLNRPSRPGVTAPPAERRTDRERTRTGPTAEWVGADEARAEAGRPVLDAPARPPAGSRVSRLEEVPQSLRSRAAKAAAGPAQPARPGSVSPELSKRHTDRTKREQPIDDEARGVVTDEQAFDVATPGGGVVTSQRDQPAYEPEPRRAIGGQ